GEARLVCPLCREEIAGRALVVIHGGMAGRVERRKAVLAQTERTEATREFEESFRLGFVKALMSAQNPEVLPPVPAQADRKPLLLRCVSRQVSPAYGFPEAVYVLQPDLGWQGQLIGLRPLDRHAFAPVTSKSR